ncbi:hypothetical protein [Microbacterium laevaniformans]|uniref:hypothetical protein n=1 Tax=Microbacterium laevaniformans TaxID=36807 RepID=UPI0031EEA73F
MLVAFALSSQIPYFSIFWADPAVIWSLLGASALIVVVGVADDLFDLDWMIKLGAQFLAAGIVRFGGIQIFFIPSDSSSSCRASPASRCRSSPSSS